MLGALIAAIGLSTPEYETVDRVVFRYEETHETGDNPNAPPTSTRTRTIQLWQREMFNRWHVANSVEVDRWPMTTRRGQYRSMAFSDDKGNRYRVKTKQVLSVVVVHYGAGMEMLKR